MLKKIISIKNVGRFRNYSSVGDTALAKHSFIFGANGHGKTTICAILRSVKDGDPAHIIGRKTLGVTDDASIELLTSSGPLKFKGTAWDAAKPEFAIFDSAFIADNVHSGDVVDSDQKRNLYRIIIGDAGVDLAEKERKLAEDSRAKTTEIKNARITIQSHTSGMKLDDFIELHKIDDIDQKIATKKVILTTVKEATAIKERSEFVRVTIPELPADFTTLLARSIDDIAKDAEQQIQTHFAAHGMAVNNAAWVVQQIDHAKDSCPFCGQDINGLPLIAAYKVVFSEKYKALRSSISSMKAELDKAMGDTALAKLETFNAKHKSDFEFWAKYCTLNQVELLFPTDLAPAIASLRTAAVALIEKKAREPLEAIIIDTDQAFLQAQAAYQVVKTKIQDFNQAVDATNSIVIAQKLAADAADLAAATADLKRLEINKTRFSAAVIPLCADYQTLVKAQSDIEKQKKGIREQLDRHTETVVAPYQARINALLEAFNAEFSIAETKHNYVGGSATSTYQLVINRTQIDIGSGNTPINNPSFKNTLSGGDRSTLALAFFIAHLECDPELAKKIVIFDDPFNSQDAFRRRQTIHEIIKMGRRCAQVIVLSHDYTFLKQIWDKCQPADRAALALIDNRQKGTKILPHDLEKACQGRTATDTDDLQAFLAHGTGQHIDIIRKMRAVLETYMRSTYPVLFVDTDWLGEIVGKIRTGSDTHPAAELYNELDAINDYTKPYHHGENVADATTDTIDSTELIGFTKKTLRIVNAALA